MPNCYNCGEKITPQNESEEHIILNACGGRLKSKKLLCKDCNSDFGDKFDASLAHQTNFLSHLLNISRHRGQPQPIEGTDKTTGESYTISLDGKPRRSNPKVDQQKTDEGTKVNIQARDENELKKILEGFKRKFPKLDVDKALEKAQRKKEYLDRGISFQQEIGGNEVAKSILKTAINFYIFSGGEKNFIQNLLPELKKSGKTDYVTLFYPSDDLYNPDAHEVSHILNVVGDPIENKLYVYCELYNVYQYLILLNDNYTGNEINESYKFDLIDSEELESNFSINLSTDELEKAFNSNVDSDIIEEKIERVLKIAEKLKSTKKISDIVEESIDDTLGQYPEGTTITEDMVEEFITELIDRLILHFVR